MREWIEKIRDIGKRSLERLGKEILLIRNRLGRAKRSFFERSKSEGFDELDLEDLDDH